MNEPIFLPTSGLIAEVLVVRQNVSPVEELYSLQGDVPANHTPSRTGPKHVQYSTVQYNTLQHSKVGNEHFWKMLLKMFLYSQVKYLGCKD